MKTGVGIILGIVIGAIVIGVIVLLVYAHFLPSNPQITNSSGYSTTLTPAITSSLLPTSQSTVPMSTRALPSSQANVNFALNITNISGSGLSRTITAQLTNSGTNDAHNVSATITAYLQGVKVNVTGDTSLTLGTIPAGETITKPITLSFSIFDAPEILKNGVTINLILNSDEKTQTLTYTYKP